MSGQAFHAPFLHIHPGFNLVKVLERHHETSREAYPYVSVVKDLTAVVKDEAVDLVVITTPNMFHFEQVKTCLEAGKHVVVEKPFMNSSADCDAIMELAEKKGCKLFVYQNRRWDGDFLTLHKIIRSGVLGEMQHYEAHFDRYSPTRKRAAWRDEDQPGSGILFDLGPHLIDQAVQLFGYPAGLKADIQSQREGSKVDDYFKLEFDYGKLKVILTAGMLVEEHELRYVLHGSNGSYIKYGIDPQEAMLRKGMLPEGNDWGKESPENYGLITLDEEGEDFDGILETLPGNYMAFYDNVYEVLVNGAEQAVKPAEARNVIRLIELAFQSSRQNEKVAVALS